MNYKILPLTIKEVGAYKNIRLKALLTDPGVFRSSYDEEANMPDSYWQNRLAKSNACIFGLYKESLLVGITGIAIEEAGHGYLTHTYILPEHRGQGLSKLFFETRITWAKNRGLQRLVINHRKSNHASRANILKYGFVFTHAEDVLWQDGASEELLHYELYIYPTINML